MNIILTFNSKVDIILVINHAWMAKLADAQDLKSWELRFVRVQVPLCALVFLNSNRVSNNPKSSTVRLTERIEIESAY